MKKIVYAFLATVLLLSMIGCTKGKNGALGSLDNKHLAVLEDDLKIFADGNISEITECIFGVASDSEVTDHTSNGIISDLFANAEVKISSTDESAITYTIMSPDISDFFQVYADDLQTITTSEELGEAFLNYSKTAPQKEYTVSLNYAISDEGIEVVYDNPEFINAMTGGLLDAYADLYAQYLEGGG